MTSQTIKEIVSNYVSEIPEKHEITFITNPEFGDYSSNIAFLLTKIQNRTAVEIADELATQLAKHKQFSRVSVAGKGFINFTLSDEFLLKELQSAVNEKYGRIDLGKSKKILVEYISANPTGPLNVVQARAGAFGNALVNLLRFANYDAQSEYYINNTGTQIDLLYESFLARINELNGKPFKIPEGGYPGTYLINIAKEVIQNKIPEPNWREFLLQSIISSQQQSLKRFGVTFNRFAEESNFKPRQNDVLSKIKNFTYRQEGALWFKATDFTDNEDRVLITANDHSTYFLADLAYHWDKFEREFELLINVWGPDHHGYIERMKSGLSALGFNPDRFTIIIAQQVTLLRNREKVVMSKRAGEFVTLDDVLIEIGPDALKFFLLMRRASQHIEFDLALAKKTSQENPIYYVQYAYARINSIIKFAHEKGINQNANPDLSFLSTPEERSLIKMIIRYPDVVFTSARNFEPHHLIYYILELSNSFHKFYEGVRVVSDDSDTMAARIFLCQATQQIIKNTLGIIDVAAPEKM